MQDHFNVLYDGISYTLQAKWYKLSRGEIEYALNMFKSGHFDTLTDALEWVDTE